MVRLGEMPWFKTDATHYHDKGRAIKGLVDCWMLLNLIPWLFGYQSRDLAPLGYP